ncbi:MAG: LPS export ABC transporter periplasmic protein LptC [Ignavibacteria bacterium]|jgi:LPS export ABC transporter protein LptC|nr:LPS export ABC transporter periplasmic protein LptC [Ignavibacteria bacterium]MCU7503657.1 LPS export ABC transporter periplasmic protein LptC [Ignavibacteria bacterium]MCU7517860.1 LPS export ABC transporter periplasmic protein LptC [Ignavibacteria bacterium]
MKIFRNKKITGSALMMAEIAFFFAAASWLFTGCSEEKIKPPVLGGNSKGELPTQESWNFQMMFTDEGKLKAVLTSSHARVFEDKKETLLDTVRIDFYNDAGQKTSTLTSLKGRVDGFTNNMYAIDSVVARNDSGTTLKTQELMWRNKDRKIVSDKFVTIVSPREKIQGYGVVADQSLRNYVIYKPTFVTAPDNVSGGVTP